MRLGVDPRKADQMIRGTVSLPNGTGKAVRVAVFAAGDQAREAEAAGADIVGADDLVARSRAASSTSTSRSPRPTTCPRSASSVARSAPAASCPTRRRARSRNDVGKTVEEFKAGKVEYRTDRYGNVHVPIGKVELRRRRPRRELPGGARRDPPGQAGGVEGPVPQGRHHRLRPWARASTSTPPAPPPEPSGSAHPFRRALRRERRPAPRGGRASACARSPSSPPRRRSRRPSAPGRPVARSGHGEAARRGAARRGRRPRSRVSGTDEALRAQTRIAPPPPQSLPRRGRCRAACEAPKPAA